MILKKNYKLKKLKIVSLVILFSITYGQSSYNSVKDLEQKWENYTSYQKEELLSFMDFLFQEKKYDKCITAGFRYNFLYPEDTLIPEIYFFIARSYEELSDYNKALEFYKKSQNLLNINSSLFKSNQYRIAYVYLMLGNFNEVNKISKISKDPYLITFNGFAKLNDLDFIDSKKEFSKARKLFKSKSDRRYLSILMRACDNVKKLPNLNPYRAAMYGIIPGGGRLYLQEYRQAIATFSSVLFLSMNLNSNFNSTILSKWVPRIGFVIIYGGSIYGSYKGIEEANMARERRYINRIQRKYNSKLFLNFPEPKQISNKP